MNNSDVSPHRKKAHVIIIGNEKGGCGKTTTSIHTIVALLRLGFSVGSMDIDSRQRSLSRYIENRRNTMKKRDVTLPLPHHVVIQKSLFADQEEVETDERKRFIKGLGCILYSCDFVVIDCPGNDTNLSRLAHSCADTIITPINDSFIDLDVLASIDGSTLEIIRPSIYSEMVWEQKLKRAKRDKGTIEWIVMRNRLSNLAAKNKRYMEKATRELSRRIGFRIAPGFSERVIYREMFLQGLTVLDVLDTSSKKSVTMSHLAARREVSGLLKMLRIPEVDRRLAEKSNEEISKAKDKKAKPTKKAVDTLKKDIKAKVAAMAEKSTTPKVETENSDTQTTENTTSKQPVLESQTSSAK